MTVDLNILITALAGILTTVASAWISWFVTRRKYNSEIDSNEIANLKHSLEFYEKIVQDNNEKLQVYIKISNKNIVEVYRLKGVVYRLLNNTCLSNGCSEREFYTEEQIKEILEGVYNEKKENKENKDSKAE